MERRAARSPVIHPHQWRFSTASWPGNDSQNFAQMDVTGNPGLDSTSTNDTSNPASPTTSPSKPWDQSWQECLIHPDSASEEMKDSLPLKTQKRREQNRASQRAFRVRKETHVKHLQVEISQLRTSYEDLLESFAAQTQEISNLKASLEQLGTKLQPPQFDECVEWNAGMQSPSTFDKFSFDWADLERPR